ncbi:MAG: hypothetical protein WCT50_03215 [Patescibacteria group bacterium]
MRKIILLALLVVATMSESFGQFRDNANLSLFTGGYAAQQNGNNNGYWYGLYAEYMPIKTVNGLNLGLCAVADRVNFKSNTTLSSYNGGSDEFGAGIAMGKYSEYFTQKHSAYFGANLMLKSIKDNGTGLSMQSDGKLGTYTMVQEDLMFSAELNINLLKTFGNIFPRSQWKLSYKKPLKSEKTSFWNKAPIKESMIWSKAAIGAEFKQSIVQIGRLNTMVEPKLMIGYQHYVGDDSDWLSAGPEIALKKLGWDDFLSIYVFAKKQVGNFPANLNSLQFVAGLNLNLSNLKK